jgi:H+-transporting ATPase
MPDTVAHPMRTALEPVPWMLEAAIVIELALGKYVEAGIIALLLVFNAALGLFQESWCRFLRQGAKVVHHERDDRS